MKRDSFEQASRLNLKSQESENTLYIPKLWNNSLKKHFPMYSERERLRRIRQIATGQLTHSNGLAWPGQVIFRSNGKKYLQRPFTR